MGKSTNQSATKTLALTILANFMASIVAVTSGYALNSATRSLPSTYTAGVPFQVTINVTLDSSACASVIVESPPSAWVTPGDAIAIGAKDPVSGTIFGGAGTVGNDRKIRWTNEHGACGVVPVTYVLTYTAKPTTGPCTDYPDQVCRFTGDLSVGYLSAPSVSVSLGTNTIIAGGGPAATSTPTKTGTRSPTPIFTATRTATPSSTATVAPTHTFTRTPVGTNPPTPTRTSTPTITRTPTITISPTITRTPTPTRTGTRTATPTRTPVADVVDLVISGRVTYRGAGLAQVMINAGGLGFAVSDPNGYYSIARNVASGTEYSLSASMQGYVFTPDAVCGFLTGNTEVNFEALLVNKIYPIVECVESNGDGTYSAHFGYRNTGATKAVSVGKNNGFNPLPQDRGQPIVFKSGRFVDRFTAEFSERPIAWSVLGNKATAWVDSPVCCQGVLDQCGVCNGDGSSCNSCSQSAAAFALNDLTYINEQQMLVIKKSAASLKKIDPSSKKLGKNINKSALAHHDANRSILQALGELLPACSDAESCSSDNLCALSMQYQENSQSLMASAKKLAKAAKLAAKRQGISTRASIKTLSEAQVLHQENYKAIDSLPEMQMHCGK